MCYNILKYKFVFTHRICSICGLLAHIRDNNHYSFADYMYIHIRRASFSYNWHTRYNIL